MNRTALFGLLALSLVANASLGFLALRRAPGSAGATPAASVSAAPTVAKNSPGTASALSAAAAKLTEKLAAPRTGANLREIAAELRAAGFSDSLVKMVLQSLVNEELMRRQSAIFDWSAVPYWKESRPTPEQMRAMRELQKERRTLLADAGLPLSPIEEAFRRRQYGGLSETKAAALEKIQQDYNDMRQEMFEQQQRGGPTNGRDLAAQQKLLQEEQDRDIAALLTPEEKTEYELRNSNAANQVRSQLRGLDVNEQEFRDLFAAQKAYEAASPRQMGGPASVAQLQSGLAAWEDYQRTAQNVLGAERYRDYLVNSQLGNSAAKTFFAERPGISTSQIQDLARLTKTIPIEMQSASAPGLSNDDRRALMAAASDKLRARAVQILGAQYAQEAENARVLQLPRTGSNVTPAVRLPGGG